MKKIYLALTFVAGTLLSSCDMDLAPIGSLVDDEAIENISGLEKARNGVYEGLRNMTTGGYLYYSDLQMDQFMGLTINGNRNGLFAHGNIYSNNEYIQAIWGNCYSCIADANFFLDHVDHVLAQAEDETEKREINRYIAEVKFARAYYYAYLFDHFCESYTTAKGDQAAKGLPLVTVYHPTGNVDSYPGRSTMNETFELIDQDLKDAYENLKAYEAAEGITPKPMDYYVNSNVVLALQARLALLRQDWKTAVEKANAVIATECYELANVDNYAAMWAYDQSDEIIFRPISSKTELGIGSTGGAYIDAAEDKADYVPTYSAGYEAYEDGDVRFDAFLDARRLSANGTSYPAFVFNKFPGNKDLYTNTTNNLMNMGKPFRLSEIYLILAEASYENNDATTANSALNMIRKNRIEDYEDATYSGEVLRQQIREERTKELIGEGFRMSDLRRWGLGFTRDSSYPISASLPDIFVVVDTQVSYIPGDHRYVWPIPSYEMEANPQLKGQQKPGY